MLPRRRAVGRAQLARTLEAVRPRREDRRAQRQMRSAMLGDSVDVIEPSRSSSASHQRSVSADGASSANHTSYASGPGDGSVVWSGSGTGVHCCRRRIRWCSVVGQSVARDEGPVSAAVRRGAGRDLPRAGASPAHNSGRRLLWFSLCVLDECRDQRGLGDQVAGEQARAVGHRGAARGGGAAERDSVAAGERTKGLDGVLDVLVGDRVQDDEARLQLAAGILDGVDRARPRRGRRSASRGRAGRARRRSGRGRAARRAGRPAPQAGRLRGPIRGRARAAGRAARRRRSAPGRSRPRRAPSARRAHAGRAGPRR